MIGALLALLTIILHPGGISDQVAPLVRWFSGKKFSFHADDGIEEERPKRVLKRPEGEAQETATLEKTEDASGDAAAAADTKGEPSTPGSSSLTAALGHATGAAATATTSPPGDGQTSDSDETTQIPAAAAPETSQNPAGATTKKKSTRRRAKPRDDTSSGDDA